MITTVASHCLVNGVSVMCVGFKGQRSLALSVPRALTSESLDAVRLGGRD